MVGHDPLLMQPDCSSAKINIISMYLTSMDVGWIVMAVIQMYILFGF